MAAKKKPTSHRPYTGFNGIAGGTAAGLQMLIRRLEKETGKGLWNNGAWGIRDMKGKPGQPSVHSCGRAVDMSWRDMPDDRGKPNYRPQAQKVIDVLVANADALGLELIIDYFPHPWGRAWRCDRNRWRSYDGRTVSGAPGSDWYHIEISCAMAANPEGMKAALDKAFGDNPPQP